ncbi:MAG: class I SAM-dependent methyltransferase [Anaerolineae bacterium]
MTARRKGIAHSTWTALEPRTDSLNIDDGRFRLVQGDGCEMPFCANSLDTALCIQVLEHVFEPIKMVQEIARVLKPGGTAIFLVPQTGNLHCAPHHYQNFTRFWLLMTMDRADLEIVELSPLGGAWSTIASRLVYLLLQSRGKGKLTYPEAERNLAFYLLLPIMWLFALLCIPICLFLSLGDLVEEPNNHLCVARKPHHGKSKRAYEPNPL